MKATSCPLLSKTPLGAKCCALLKTFYRKFSELRWVERNLSVDREVGDKTQGFRRMAARNKPAGIRVLVYGMGKGKAVIEGLSVSDLQMNVEVTISSKVRVLLKPRTASASSTFAVSSAGSPIRLGSISGSRDVPLNS